MTPCNMRNSFEEMNHRPQRGSHRSEVKYRCQACDMVGDGLSSFHCAACNDACYCSKVRPTSTLFGSALKLS
jgi:hypothetical protein